MVTLAQKKEVVKFICRHRFSERRACRIVGIERKTVRYQSKRTGDEKLEAEITNLAFRYTRFGYRRIWACLRRSGQAVNRKRVFRIWQKLGLGLCRKQTRKRAKPTAGLIPAATAPNEVWTYDFVFDRTMNGNRLKLLTLCDEFSREALAVEVARTFTGKDVKSVLERVFLERGSLPKYIRSDNGSEFIASPVRQWLREREVKTIYIEPGRPWQNGKGESFNGKLRDECLAQEWFYNLREAKVVIEQWRRFYNSERPHSSLNYLTPEEYRLKYAMKESEIKSENLAFSLG